MDNIKFDYKPLTSMSMSTVRDWPLVGSIPFSKIYFSINLFSNTQPDVGEMTGCSGVSLLTKIEITSFENI